MAVALEEGRSAIGIELNPAYLPLIEERLAAARAVADQLRLDWEEPAPAKLAQAVQTELSFTE